MGNAAWVTSGAYIAELQQFGGLYSTVYIPRIPLPTETAMHRVFIVTRLQVLACLVASEVQCT